MSAITILALLGLIMWCGALSRRLVHSSSLPACMPGDDRSGGMQDEQLADLTESYHRLEAEFTTRVTELEERLDFAERLLAQERQRAHLGGSA